MTDLTSKAWVSDESVDLFHRAFSYITRPRTKKPTSARARGNYRGDYSPQIQEVASELRVSVERARQIERTALRKCRNWCKKNGFELLALLGFR